MPRLDRFATGFYTARMDVYPIHRSAACVAMLIAMLIPGAGCGSKVLQYPEDHERYVRIDKAVESLREAYVKKDLSGMTSLMVPTEQLERLQGDAEGDFEAFQKILLEFRVERIMIENDDIDVYVHWQGVWKKDLEDPGLRQRGHSRLQWVGTKAVLLRGLQGDAPFGIAARQSGVGTPSTKK
ncbi:conserved exported protein of unknown function [Nitrospira sp. KM1]|uniref:hypothetical protein n=1 Tax=Nitrospira sp. KM1 TaxID=1936990 RepID=UPI0013A74BFF|nr:hypothetical protein [Nitrospira sp. KM1]BCA54744.1 conserved exported protein of unknown function [Nitrospira sp. KM1]